jgi:two-component system cell cycle sensor histidine kinase/response regulator CckA
VNEGDYLFAWVGYALQDENKQVLPMARAGHDEGYLDEVKVSWSDDVSGRGPAGRAIRLGREMIVRDVQTSPDFAPWRAAALERGYQSIISLPLLQEDQAFGVIAIYSAECDAFDAEEVNLLKMLADDVAYGISALWFRSAHEATEVALIESEINLKRAQEMAHLGSWEYDFSSDKMIWSDELYRILGHEPGTIMPSLSLLLESVSSDQRRTVEQRLHSSIKDGETRSQEFSVIRPDGELRHVISHLVVYSDSEQGTNRVAGTMMDVTEQKRSESERQSLQSQLQHAQKLEAIGQLTGGVAHDFNNILSSIMGYTTLAMEECPLDDSEYLGYLEEVSKAGARAKELISQLMTFSRRDTRTVETIDPGSLVQDAFSMLKTALPAAIEFDFESEPDVLPVRADEVQLHQVITNLVINARDAIDKYGKVTLRMRRKELHHCLCTSCQQRFSGDYIEISVKDDGKGISDENMITMFEPFFTTKEKGKGTGMGLSMVHGLIHSHEGHICVKSVSGQGSTFSIYLPVYCGEDAPASKDKTVVKALPGRAIRMNGDATILLVDDEVAVTQMISDILTRQGYRCIQSHSPAEALKHYLDEPESYDLVITDQVMQQMDGMEMVRRMQAQRDGLPVILCSGYTSELKETDIARAGFYGVIQKPIDAGKLVSLVGESLAARSRTG